MSAVPALWILLSALGWAYAFFVYSRRELPVRGRRLLVGLRACAISLLLLLLLDLPWPFGGGGPGRWVLVDASPSMQVVQGTGVPLQQAWESVGTERASVAVFGSPVRIVDPVPADPIPVLEASTDSRLAPALKRALEAGAREIRVLTDLRIDDPVEVASLLAGAGATIRFEDFGGEIANAGIGELALPETARSGETVRGEALLFGTIDGPARLAVSIGGQAVWDSTVALESGREVRVTFPLTLPDRAGPAEATLALTAPGDAHTGDDRRSGVVDIGREPGGLVLVSWTPDWEPRFLLPVLAEVTGLAPRGFLRVGEDRFLSMEAPARIHTLEEVSAALEEARLGVAHALPEEPDPRLGRAVARSPRLIVLPGDGDGSGRGGEWYLSNEIPPSPVAGEIAGVPLLGLPPLRGLEIDGVRGVPALLVQSGGSGDAFPALTIIEESGGRRVYGAARGYWRWAFRDGAPRELYRRLWSGVASWLLSGGATDLRETGLVPQARVVRPGDVVQWRAGPAAGGRLRVVFTPVRGGGVPVEYVAAVDSLGRVELPSPGEPGSYTWDAEVESGPGEGHSASGLLVVEVGDEDLRSPRAAALLEGGGGSSTGGSGGGRPLRTHSLPYLLLLGMLSAEWIVRRRSGLR